MTAKQFLEEREMYNPDIEDVVLGYTRLKCQELLLLVAEKASKLPATIHYSSSNPRYARLDRDSILNAVDLDSFIS